MGHALVGLNRNIVSGTNELSLGEVLGEALDDLLGQVLAGTGGGSKGADDTEGSGGLEEALDARSLAGKQPGRGGEACLGMSVAVLWCE